MANYPRHIAIVMDGNGRWAKRRGMPRVAGHRAGAKAVRKAIKFAATRNVEVLTLFALSVENKNKRPATEVSYLMSLFLESLQKNTTDLHKNNIKIKIVGDHADFNEKLLEQIKRTELLTQNNTGMTLNVAINYSGRWDIVQATQKIADTVARRGMDVNAINDTLMQQHLCFNDVPEPDLLIRTSGEQRISNFMLWQFAYTELYFTPVFWPDFNDKVFEEALAFFATRQRRFGLISEQAYA